MAIKINMYPIPKTIPDSMGTTQEISEDNIQPSQRRDTTYRGPPRQASGKY
jgi:hypothetical protein